MCRSLLPVACCLLASLGGIARAIEATPSATASEVVTLESLVSTSLAENPELRFYEAEVTAARAARQNAALIWPASSPAKGSPGA